MLSLFLFLYMLHYKTYGEGEPLLILHGLFGSLDNWQTIGKKWAEHYQVVLVDLPNHGKSPHTKEFSYKQMASAVAELVEHLGFQKINMLGHSMGGKTTMEFSVEYPHLLNKIIVVDIAPKSYPPHHQQILEGLFSIKPKQITSRREADDIMSNVIQDKGVRMFLLKNLSRDTEDGFKWKMNLELLSNAVNDVISSSPFPYPVQIPALFIRGEKSNYILDTDFDDIKSKYPQVEIKTIKGAGHWVHAEKPSELHDMVLEFIQN